MITYRISVCGDRALCVSFDESDPYNANKAARWLEKRVELLDSDFVCECFVTMCALNVIYNPAYITYAKLSHKIGKILKRAGKLPDLDDADEKRTIHCIPVCFCSMYGEDLAAVCTALSTDEQAFLTELVERNYLIYSLSAPGTADLSATPFNITGCGKKKKAPAGSIVLEADKINILPSDSVVSGMIIGRAAVPVYRPHDDEPVGFRAGEYIRFVPITENKFKKTANKGKYEIQYKRLGSLFTGENASLNA